MKFCALYRCIGATLSCFPWQRFIQQTTRVSGIFLTSVDLLVQEKFPKIRSAFMLPSNQIGSYLVHIHVYLFPPAFSHWAKLLCPFRYVSLIVCGLVRGTMIFSKDVILWGSLHYQPRLHDQIPVIIICDIRERTQEERSKMCILVLPSSVTYLGDSINSWWLQNWLNFFFFKLGTRLLCSPLRFTLRIR